MVAFNAYSLCREAEAYYLAFIVGNGQDTAPQQITDHIRQCRYCRSQIERLGHILDCAPSNDTVFQTKDTGTMLKLHFAYLGRQVTCNIVKPFLPTLLDHALEIKIPTPITVHLDHCQNCSNDLETIRELNLSRVQLCKLSQALADKTKDKYINSPNVQAAASKIIDRPESGIVTVCHAIDSQDAKIPSAGHHGDLYAGFPINVEVSDINTKKQAALPTAVITETNGFSVRRLTPIVKFGGLAAAVAIAALIFLFTKPAVSLKQIHKSVMKAENVYIASFTPDSTEPRDEKWVSRTHGIYMLISDNKKEMYDIKNNLYRTRIIATGQTTESPLSPDNAAGTKMFLNGTFGLMPFENISELPRGSQWHRLTDRNEQDNTSILEVYDLLWTQKTGDGSAVGNKWRVFVNAESRLPTRTEFYQILPDKQEYTLKSFNVVSYPSNDEIEAIVKALFF